ncbi:ankyrin repeat and SOCS box protein 2 [Menidia menidia]
MTGSGKRMVAYRRPDGGLVHVAQEPEEEEEPLFRAIREGDARKVRELAMGPGENLMLPSKPGWLAVHQAAWFGKDTCLRMLLAAQPGMVNKRTARGETPLMVAATGDNLECVQVLLENGAEPDIPSYDKETPLYKACEKSNAAVVAALLNHGAEVNTRCLQGWTALQEAVLRNNVEICEMLLKAGAKYNLSNMYGITPLFTAAQSGQVDTLRFLLKHGADINTQAADGATALYEAAKNGHEQIVELLLSQNADANKPGRTGLLPLHIAAQRSSNVIVSMLIPATSKARVRRTGISPLHLAAERNRDDVLEMLIEAGFDVNAQLSEERSRLYEDRRSTVLYFSVYNNNVEAVRSLLAAGADPNLDVFRPLMVAARLGCTRTVTLLVEHGADINASIPTHPTTFPAVYMFSMKYLPLFKYLLDQGGDALSCFDCVYGGQLHPPIKTSRSGRNDGDRTPEGPLRGVQFCEMISVSSISRWAGPIIDVLLDYVGHVTLCSRLKEHLDSYSEWNTIKEKAAPPRPLMQLCRLQILRLVRRRQVKRLPLPGGLIRFLQHQQMSLDDY